MATFKAGGFSSATLKTGDQMQLDRIEALLKDLVR